MMENGVKRWLREGGERFLRALGIKQGQIIVDFGCGAGHYTIPAAKILGKEGTVYAIDKDRFTLKQVMQKAKSENLNNIIPLNTSGTLKIDLDDETIDVVLSKGKLIELGYGAHKFYMRLVGKRKRG